MTIRVGRDWAKGSKENEKKKIGRADVSKLQGQTVEARKWN